MVGGTDSSCEANLAWLASRDPELGLKHSVALQSSKFWRKTAADRTRRRGVEGAQRLCCQGARVPGVLLYRYGRSECKPLSQLGVVSLRKLQWFTRKVVGRGSCDGTSRNSAYFRFHGPCVRAARSWQVARRTLPSVRQLPDSEELFSARCASFCLKTEHRFWYKKVRGIFRKKSDLAEGWLGCRCADEERFY